MELLISFVTALTEILAFSTVLCALSYIAALRGLFVQPDIWRFFGGSFIAAAALRGSFKRLRDPLRAFPAVDTNDIRVLFPVTDVPRGKSALEWAKQHPEADVVRVRAFGSTVALVPLSVAALRDVLSTRQLDFIKPIAGSNYLARVLGYGLILSEGDVHARQRKHLTSSFRVQNIRALHDLMLAKADLLIERMSSEAKRDGSCDITIWGSKVTLDIIGPTLMNMDFESLTSDSQPVHDAFTELTASSPGHTRQFALGLFLPKFIVENLPTAINRMAVKNVKIARDSCREGLDRLRASEGKEGEDNSSSILNSITKDPLASDTEIIDQMMTFLGAGHETTATTIAWVAHFLTLPENEQYQDLLRDEINSSPDCTSSPASLEALPWLNAICEESLRLFPPVTTTGRKAIRDTMIAGVPVPKGALVTLFPWANNRDPRHWGGEDAEKFLPERWIDKKDDGSLHINNHGGAASNFCSMTFLQGNRSCIGKGFAKTELRVIIARLFGSFRVRRLPGDDGEVNPVGSLTIKPEGGLMVSLEKVP